MSIEINDRLPFEVPDPMLSRRNTLRKTALRSRREEGGDGEEDGEKERSSSQPSGLTSSQRSTGSTIFEPSDDEEGSRGSADEVSSDEDDDGGVDHDSERSADAREIGNGVDVGTSTDRKRARGQQSSSGVKRVEKRGREEGSSVCQSKKVAKRG